MTINDRFFGYSGDAAVKLPVVTVTTGPITLFDVQTVNSVVLNDQDRILVNNQADATTNGIYIVLAGLPWIRSPDFDGARDAVTGSLVFVKSDVVGLAPRFWQLATTDSPITFGTSEINFVVVLIETDVAVAAAQAAAATATSEAAQVAANTATVAGDTATVIAYTATVVSSTATVQTLATQVAANTATVIADAAAVASNTAIVVSDTAAVAANTITCSTAAASASSSAIIAAGARYGTSTTSNTIGTGTLTFTTQPGLNLPPTGFVTAAYTSGPSNYVYGQIFSYNTATGLLQIAVISTNGTGTYANWVISPSGPQGPGGGGTGTVNTGMAGQLAFYAANGTTISPDSNVAVSAGTMTLGMAGTSQGSLKLSGATSGTTTIAAPAVGTGTMLLQAGTDTLTGRATTDTLTNKTFDTAGAGNALKVNGNSITGISGNTATVATTSGAFTTGHLLVADSNGNAVDGGTIASGIAAAIKSAIGYNTYYNSGQLSIAVDGYYYEAHGLGAVPVQYKAEIVCISADNGYSVGDVVDVTHTGGEDTANSGWTSNVFVNSTYIGYQVGLRGLFVAEKSNGTAGPITFSKWNMVLKAWA